MNAHFKWVWGLLLLVLVAGLATPLPAQKIYHWIDAEGVHRYTNKPPPSENRKVVEKFDEIPHDAEADRKRMVREDASFEEWLAKEQEKQARAEEALIKAQAEEERLAEARRQQELEDKVRALEQDVEEAKDSGSRGIWFFPPGPPVISPYTTHGSNRPGHFPGYRSRKPDKDRPGHGRPPANKPEKPPAEEEEPQPRTKQSSYSVIRR